jgi:hypothetical protein
MCFYEMYLQPSENFMTLQYYFLNYCRYTEAVKLFKLLLSPYSLVGICTNIQNCTAETRDHINVFSILRGYGIRESWL